MDKKAFRIVLRIAKANGGFVAVSIVLNFCQILVGNYTNVTFQRLLDGLPGARSMAAITPLLAWYIGTWVVNHLLIYLEGIPGAWMVTGVRQWVKLDAMQKISRMDFQAYRDLGTGNMIQVIDNGAEAVQKIFNGFYISNLFGLMQFGVGLYFIHFYDRTLFTLILGGYGIFYLGCFYLMRFLKNELEHMLANQEDFSRYSVRAFMEMVVFRINGHFKEELARARSISDEIVRARAKVYLLQELSYTGFALLIFLVEAGVVIEQAGKILAGTSTVGTLVALVGFIRLVFWPVIGLGQSWMAYRLDMVTFARFDRLMSLPDDPGLARTEPLKVDAGRITFEGVSFAYEDMTVLENFSLALEGGRTTAFVGASGSGKSTLVRLLLHLLKPQAGQICVDGQDLAGVNLETYYRAVAYVPQEPPIFDGTLRENLTFNQPVDAAHLAEVARRVGLADLLARLPKGLETLVGERGLKLSGGERQRLAFGRVLLQDPRIVLLDEPTSSLDSLTEAFVTQNMLPFLKGKTVIIVAHRLQTVKDADLIVVLDSGRVIQQGRFEALLAVDGKFRDLWQKQMQETD